MLNMLHHREDRCTHWKTWTPRKTRQPDAAGFPCCSWLSIKSRITWVSLISCSGTHVSTGWSSPFWLMLRCFKSRNEGSPFSLATESSPFWPFGPDPPISPGDPLQEMDREQNEPTEKSRIHVNSSALQGIHLLLEDLDLLHHPVYQILQSCQHHPFLQLGRGVQVEHSQWYTHIDRYHLNVYNISVEY